jgi:hypothetical protein
MSGSGGNTDALLKRGMMALEDGEWQKADGFFEEVLNLNAECAEAYLGKLMIELKLHTRKDLAECPEPFDTMRAYQKILRFADHNLVNELDSYLAQIKQRHYNDVVEAMNTAKSETKFLNIAKRFDDFGTYQDATALAQQCREKAVLAREKAECEERQSEKDFIKVLLIAIAAMGILVGLIKIL